MVLALGVLGCAELAGEGNIEIGKTEKELVLRLGNWTLVLALDTVGRFPKLEEVIERAEAGTTLLHLTPSDAQFLAGALPKLPQDEMSEHAMTLDLNGQAFVRAQTAKGTPLTELVLTNTTLTGDPMRSRARPPLFVASAETRSDRVEVFRSAEGDPGGRRAAEIHLDAVESRRRPWTRRQRRADRIAAGWSS